MTKNIKDPTSLENLHDIIVPDPIPWWPPAAVWYILGTLAFVSVILMLTCFIIRWKKNRYRSQALIELARLQTMSEQPSQRQEAILRTAELLKRVALAAWPRQTVAQLSGKEWSRFLNQTSRRDIFPVEATLQLHDVAYDYRNTEQLTTEQVQTLLGAAANWIRDHDSSIVLSEFQGEDEQ